MSDYRVDADVDFNEANERVRAEIRRTIVSVTGRLEWRVKSHLTDGSPYLKRDSGRLAGSVVSQITDNDDAIEGMVAAGGTNLRYLFVHEFGLTGAVSIKTHLRTIKKAFGRPIAPKQVMVNAFSRKVNFRERRMMRDSLDEVAKIVPKNIDAAIQRGLNSE